MVKKVFLVLAVSLIAILLVGFVATAEEGAVETISENAKQFVKEFAENNAVDPASINNISEVDFNALPKEVEIENVGDTNLAIYEVDYNESNEQKKIFVISYSVEKLEKQGDIIVAQDRRNFLDFGVESAESSRFLKTSAGIESSTEKGYVMARSGSITAVSTSLGSEGSSSVDIEIIIYKNGEAISFGNVLESSGETEKDYDIQSKGVVTFQPGDVISAYVKVPSGITAKDVITLVEITTTN